MSEKMSEVYEAYDMEVINSGRGRGFTLLRTDKGTRRLCPCNIGEARLAREREFKDNLYDTGFTRIDRCVADRDGELITCDRYGNPYILMEYFEGRECNPNHIEELEAAAENLAEFHKAGRLLWEKEAEGSGRTFDGEPGGLSRKVKELKRVRQFISGRKVKSDFELMYIKHFNYYFQQALEAAHMMEEAWETDVGTKGKGYKSDKEGKIIEVEHGEDPIGGQVETELGQDQAEKSVGAEPEQNTGVGYCHGSYSYHNVIITEDGIATVNFDSFHVGFQLVDLYQFTRKVIEKTGYRLETARRIIEAYGQVQPLTAKDHEYIYILLNFPEKFWKVSNHYINSRKSWISPVNIEKIRKIIEHEQEKQKFLNDFSCYFGVHKITK